MKTKYFFENLTKTDYFNTGFVSLQYKNTNRYWSKYSNKITENHIFFEIIFLKNFCSSGPDPAQKKTGPKSARNKLGPGFYRAGLSPAAWAGLGFQPKTNIDWLLRTSTVTGLLCICTVTSELYCTNSKIAFHCSSELYFTWTVKCKEMVHAQRRGEQTWWRKRWLKTVAMACWAISRTQTHTIYVVRQLAYSTELLVCINEAYKQYKQRGGESSQLNSTLKLSLLFSVLSSLCVFTLCNSSVLLLCDLLIHIPYTSRGGAH
jgi:hypothetical protein